MPKLPEGFNARERKEAPKDLAKASPEKGDMNPIERAHGARAKTEALTQKQRELVAHSRKIEQTLKKNGELLPADELDQKVLEDMEKHMENEMPKENEEIDLTARIDGDHKVSGGVSTYDSSVPEARENDPSASLRNLYDMMRTKPTVIGMSSVSNFDREIRLDEDKKQIMLSETIMMKLASRSNKHGINFLQVIDRETKDANGYIRASNVVRATTEWLKFIKDVADGKTQDKNEKEAEKARLRTLAQQRRQGGRRF